MDWSPYTAALGTKDNKSAKSAFEVTLCKIRNIANAMGSDAGGPAAPAAAAPKKKASTATGAGGKRKAPVSNANDGDNDDSDNEADVKPTKKRARHAADPEAARIKDEMDFFGATFDGNFNDI